MKRGHKISLATIGLAITIATGVMTLIEKTVNVVTAFNY